MVTIEYHHVDKTMGVESIVDAKTTGLGGITLRNEKVILLMIIRIKILNLLAVIMFHAIAKANMIIVSVRDTEVKVEEVGLLVGAAAA